MFPFSYCILSALLIHNIKSEHCSLEITENCVHQKASEIYSKDLNEKYSKYIKRIENAEKHYVPCLNETCECYEDVISRDLWPFKKNGIDKELMETAKHRGTLYQIIEGSLYREKDCMFPSRCAGIEHFILSIIDDLPNMEFVVNVRDYPQSSKHFGGPLPIFSFSKTSQYYDIMYPAWSFWEGGPAISLYPRGLGRWDQHRKSLNEASERIPWERKESKGFFRGSRTSSKRDNLILLSRSRSDLVDAQYTKNQAWKSDEDTLRAPPAPEVPLESHCKYKYLFNYQGVAASFRHKHLFLCRSLVFHEDNEWNEFYYESMKPWIHYIPVQERATQNELEELIRFAKHHDELSKKIAMSGRDFIWKRLRMSDVKCYWKKLLNNYAKLLRYTVTLDENLVRRA